MFQRRRSLILNQNSRYAKYSFFKEKSVKTKIIAILALVMSLTISGCGSGQPALSPMPTTAPVPSQSLTTIPDVSPTLAGPAATDVATEQSSEPIVYYYFVALDEIAPPEGSVMVFPNSIMLAPAQSDIMQSPDTAANIKSALDVVIHDSRNMWTSSNLEIANVAFSKGHADVVLQGEFYGVGDVVLISARMQILMTVFAIPAVQSVTITLNGDSIGNLGVSYSLDAKPADYVFMRAEIETFMAENAYAIP
jgi:hypothetical protein